MRDGMIWFHKGDRAVVVQQWLHKVYYMLLSVLPGWIKICKAAFFGQKFGEAFFLHFCRCGNCVRLFETVGTFHGTVATELWQLDMQPWVDHCNGDCVALGNATQKTQEKKQIDKSQGKGIVKSQWHFLVWKIPTKIRIFFCVFPLIPSSLLSWIPRQTTFRSKNPPCQWSEHCTTGGNLDNIKGKMEGKLKGIKYYKVKAV